MSTMEHHDWGKCNCTEEPSQFWVDELCRQKRIKNLTKLLETRGQAEVLLRILENSKGFYSDLLNDGVE